MLNDEQFRLLLDAVPNGMMVTDEAGVITFVNSEIQKMFGYSREELIGRGVEGLIPERFHAAHPGMRRHFAKSPQSQPMDRGATSSECTRTPPNFRSRSGSIRFAPASGFLSSPR
jgi:PAS domain S-box-containing protein